LTCEAFDAVKCVAAAGGIRLLIKSPIKAITLQDATLFVLIAVVIVPFGAALWGASFTISYGFGTNYWVEWRNLAVSNAVTTVVLVPAFLLGAHYLFAGRARTLSRQRVLEAALAGASTLALGLYVFDNTPAGPGSSPAFLYAPIPLLIWAALRFGLGGISVSMLIITFEAIWGTMRGHGPFLAQTPTENALALQLFLLVTATPLMLLAVVMDEERRSKDALRANASLMGLAAEAGNLAMWVWDVSGNEVWMSEGGRSLFGLEPEARLDFAATFERIHPEDRTARETAINRADSDARRIRNGVSHPAAGRQGAVDSRARTLRGSGRRHRPSAVRRVDGCNGSQAGGGVGSGTARGLEHVARAATLGELTTTLTHELRQPFAAILANAAFGVRVIDAPTPDLEQIRSALADIREVTERADDVLAGMRAMLKRDHTAPPLTDVDVNTVIHIVERIARGDANLHNVTVHLDLSADVAPVMGHSVQLQQVILNLMLNAFSAMNGSRARRLVVRTKSIDQSHVLIEVQDSGTGIDADELDSIFRSLHHHQARRTRHGPVDLPIDHRAPRRQDIGREQSRSRRDVLDHPAAASVIVGESRSGECANPLW
jgi:signal transduction histidine kinase